MTQEVRCCAPTGSRVRGRAHKRRKKERVRRRRVRASLVRPLYSLTLQFPRPVPIAAPPPLPTLNTMSDNKSCTLRTRKMMKNPLLARRQMVRLASSEREKKGGGAAGDRVRADCRGARGRPPPRRHSRAPTLGGPRPVSDAPALAGIARRGRGAPGTRPQNRRLPSLPSPPPPPPLTPLPPLPLSLLLHHSDRGRPPPGPPQRAQGRDPGEAPEGAGGRTCLGRAAGEVHGARGPKPIEEGGGRAPAALLFSPSAALTSLSPLPFHSRSTTSRTPSRSSSSASARR